MLKHIKTLCFILAVLLCTACSSPLLNLAGEKLRTGDYNAAADLYKEYLEKRPHTLIPGRKLGYALLKSGNAVDAAVRFEKVLAEFPGDSFSTLYLGLSYLHVGKRDKVLSVWEKYHAATSSQTAAEIQKQIPLIADSAPELSADMITRVDSAITAAVDADRARNAYNQWRLGDCG